MSNERYVVAESSCESKHNDLAWSLTGKLKVYRVR